MRSLRSLGVVSIAAGVAGVLHAPFHSAAYLATEEGASGGALLPWGEPFRNAFPWAFGFGDSWSVYRSIGSIEPFVLAGMLAGIWILHRLSGEGPGRFARYSFWALLLLWSVFVAATAVEYATPFRDESFLVGFPALLLSLVAFVVYGVVCLRAKVLPRDVGWCLIGGAVLFVPMAAMFGHIAMALTPLCVAIARIGVLVARP